MKSKRSMQAQILAPITRMFAFAVALFAIGSLKAAVTATDVWEDGIPSTGSQIGSNSVYTITAAASSSVGATIDLSGEGSLAKVSVLVKYSNLTAQQSGYYTLVSVLARQSSTVDNTIGFRNTAGNATTATGYYVANSLNNYRFDTYTEGGYTKAEGTVPELPTSGYLLFTHDISASDLTGTYGTALYAASSIDSLAGGVNRTLKWAVDSSNGRCIKGVSVGGPYSVSSISAAAVSTWPGVTIEKVAVFAGQTLTPSDLSSYKFPSEMDYYAAISTDTEWSDSLWKTAWVADSDATIAVSDDAILTIPDTISVGTLTFQIASGKTLTLANSGTIAAIVSNGGTLKFIGTATTPAISGTSALEIAANATVTAGGALTHSGGTTMGANSKLNTTASYGFGTGAFTSADTTAEVKYVGGGTGTTALGNTTSYNAFHPATWTGAVRLSASTNGYIYLPNFGNTGSKVIMDGIRCYIRPFEDEGQQFNVGEIEVADGGWELYGTFTGKYCVIPAKLTGTGEFHASSNLKGGVRIFLTGDVSEFNGDLRVSNGSAEAQFQILRTASATDDPTLYDECMPYVKGTIVVAEGNEATIASTAKWWAASGFIVNGTLNANSKLAKDSGSGSYGIIHSGFGTVNLSSWELENDAPNFAVSTDWTGKVVIPAFTATKKTIIHFNYLGNEGSTVVLKGANDNNFAQYIYPAEFGSTVTPTLQIDGDVYFNDGVGDAGKYTTFRCVTGSAGFYGRVKNWKITTLTNFTGKLGADVSRSAIEVLDTIALDAGATPAAGDCLVAFDISWTNIVDYANTVVTIGGETTAIKLEKRPYVSSSAPAGLYVRGIAAIEGGSSYSSVGAAVAALGATSGTITLDEDSADEMLAVAGDVTLTLADGVTLDVASLTGAGTLTVNVSDSASETATIKIPKGATIGNITSGTGITLYVAGEIASSDTLFSLTGDSINNIDSITTDYGSIHLTNTDGVFTAGRTYYWIGTSSDDNNTLITDSSKWSYEDGGSAITDSSYPSTLDTAIFNVEGAKARITSDTSATVTWSCNVVVKKDFTFINNVKKEHHIGYTASSTTINPTFTIEEGATAILQSSAGDKLHLYSKLEGSGTLIGKTDSTSTNYSCMSILGDTSEFTGVVDYRLKNKNQYNRIGSTLALDNSLARWNISTNGIVTYDGSNRTPFTQASKTYKFGVLKAWIGSSVSNSGIAIDTGYIDEDSWVRGIWYDSAQNNKVTWEAATATLTLGITNTTSVTLANTGKVYICDDKSVPTTITFSAEGALVIDENNASAAADIVGAIATPTVAAGFDVSAEATADLSSAETFNLASDVSFNKSGTGNFTITGAFTSFGTVNVSESGNLVLVVAGDGTVDTALTYTCAAGTQCSVSADNKTYTFSKIAPMVKINDGEAIYNSISAALAAASAGDTITLTGDAPTAETVTVDRSVTIVCGEYAHGTISAGTAYAVTETSGTYTTAAAAATFTWAGSAGGAWETPANWTYGDSLAATRAPQSVDTVTFADGASVTIASAASVATLNARGTVVIAKEDGYSETASLAIANEVLLGVSGSDDNLTVSGLTLTLSGNLKLGTVAGSTTSPGKSGEITLVNCTTTISGELLIVAANYADGTMTVDGGSLTLAHTSQDMVVGLSYYSKNSGGTGTFNITGGATVTCNTGSAKFCVAGKSNNSDKRDTRGILNIDNGTLTVKYFRVANGPAGNNAVVTVGGGENTASISATELLFARTNASNGNTNLATFNILKNGSISSSSKAEIFGPMAIVYDEYTATTGTAPFSVGGAFQMQHSTMTLAVTLPENLAAGTYNLMSWASKSTGSGVSAPTPTVTPNTYATPVIGSTGLTVVVQASTIDDGSGKEAGYMDGTSAVITNATTDITIPASATAIYSVLNNTNVVYNYSGTAITEANKSTTVLVYATDANGAIDTTTQIGAWCTVAVADGKVTIALDQSKVTPNLVTDDATYPPMDIGSTAITFAVPFKVGLWYAVKSGTSIGANGVLGGTTATTTPVKATSTATTPLSVDLSNASVEFYRIAVGASKAALTTND